MCASVCVSGATAADVVSFSPLAAGPSPQFGNAGDAINIPPLSPNREWARDEGNDHTCS